MPEAALHPGLGSIRLSTLYWPVAVFQLPEKRVSDAQQLAFFESIESMMVDCTKRRERVFIVTDLTFVKEAPPASQRKNSGEWMKRTAHLARAGSLGAAHVTPSAILRGLVTAVLWLQPSPTPSFCVGTVREAILKGLELLEASGRLGPPRLLSFRDNPAATVAFDGQEPRRT